MLAQRLALGEIYVTQAQAEPIKTAALTTNHRIGDLLKQPPPPKKNNTKQSKKVLNTLLNNECSS